MEVQEDTRDFYSMKRRKANFSKEEVDELLIGVRKHRSVLLGEAAPWFECRSRRQEAWQEIATKVSKVCGIERTVDEVKQKWAFMKMSAKRTDADLNAPGADPALKTVLKIIREETAGGKMREDISERESPKVFGSPVPRVGELVILYIIS